MSLLAWLVRAVFFLSIFAIDVRVRAEGSLQLPLAHDVQQEPEGCLEGQAATAGPCAFRTKRGERFALRIGEAQVSLDQQTAAIRVSESEIRLVTGLAWVKAESPFTVRTEFGATSTVGQGEIWVVNFGDRMTVSAIAGSHLLLPRGGPGHPAEALRLDEGLENWIGKVGADGRSVTGLPVAVPYVDHLKRWARLYPGSFEKFEKDALKFRAAWTKASADAVALHREVYDRKIASMADAEAKAAAERQKRESRDSQLRAMFRKKLFEE